jgi:hypothetical protein
VRKTCFPEACGICLPLKFSALLAVLLFASCGFWEPTAAIIRTDRPEFAIYAEYFNSSQEKYKIETRYSQSLTQQLTDTRDNPDIVVGSWLKSASTRGLFKPLDYLLKKEINGDTFYSRLLSLGKIED